MVVSTTHDTTKYLSPNGGSQDIYVCHVIQEEKYQRRVVYQYAGHNWDVLVTAILYIFF